MKIYALGVDRKLGRKQKEPMENIFKLKQGETKQRQTASSFTWESLGDIKKGRANLGEETPVLIYRLLEFTMMDVLTRELGEEKAQEMFRKAGFLAGKELAENLLDLQQDFSGFISQLQKLLKDLKMGIMRIEEADEKAESLILTVGEDLDCSGLPNTGEVVCHYDEGFFEGVLYAYTGKQYQVVEIDCWAKGDRVCRFRGQRLLSQCEEE